MKRVRPGSPTARIGMQKGDRVLGLGGAPLRSLADFRRKMIEDFAQQRRIRLFSPESAHIACPR